MGSHIRTEGCNPWNLSDPGPNPNPDATSRYSEFGSTTLSGTPLTLGSNGVPAGRVAWADPMSQAQANLYTLENIFGPVEFWNANPSAQPEGTGRTYLPQRDGLAWNPLEQLTLLDAIGQSPPTPSGVINFDIGLDSVYAGPGVADDPGTFWNSVSARDRTGTITLTNAYDSLGNPTTSDIVVSNAGNPSSGPIYAYSTPNNSTARPAALMEDYLFGGPYAVQVSDLAPGDYDIYVFAHGDQPNQSSTVRLADPNGGASGTTGSAGTEVRNIFGTDAEGYAYLRLSGSVAPGTSTFGFTTSGYLNGFQLVRLGTDIVIDVASGTVTQAGAGHDTIGSADTVTKTGAGTLVFNAANAYAGPTIVQAGALQVSHPNALLNSAVSVELGATLEIAGSTVMTVPGLTLAGGRVDLGDGGILITTGDTTIAAMRMAIVAGRNGGSWDGATGITSGTAFRESSTRAVGYLSEGAGVIRIALAAPGDTDLSGAVNVFDLVNVNSGGGYGTGATSDWHGGDFNYDGVTNVFDLVGVNTAGAYGVGNYLPSAGASQIAAAVPEPTSWLPIAAAAGLAIGLGRRRA